MTQLVSRPRKSRARALGGLLTAFAVGVGLLALPAASAPAVAAPPAGHGTVQLTVTDRVTGAPAEAVTVNVDPVEWEEGWEWIHGVTDANGVVSVDVPTGEYRIGAWRSDYLTSYFPGVFGWAEASTVEVEAGATVALDMSMERPASATLSVTAGGAPVVNARAGLVRIAADGAPLTSMGCDTDANGSCEITGLYPGEYRAFGSPTARELGTWVRAVWPAPGETVRIDSGDRLEAAVALAPASRITGEVHFDFQHPTAEVTAWISAQYVEEGAGDGGEMAIVSGEPGATVPFEMFIEAGRPFRLVLEGFDTAGDRYNRLIATEEWTSSGMNLLGETVTVAEGATRDFTLVASIGATLTGTYRVEQVVGASGQEPAASASSATQLERLARHAESAASMDQPADTGCAGSCGMVAIDLYQERADGWRHLEMLYGGDETAYGAEHEFAFTGLAPGTYRLGFWGDNTCHEYWQDELEFDNARSFEVTADGNVSPIAAQLQSTSGDCSDAGPRELPTPDRLAGGDRFATSVAISQRTFPGTASVVYLASGMNYPDGLAAGPAAAHQGGPVLLTPPGSVPQSVLDEIERLNPAEVVIVGGTPSVSAHAEQQVRELDAKRDVVRLGGADRFETSRMIAEHAFESADAAFLATGLKFPDALTAGPAAALLGGPVLLVHGSIAAPDAATRATLDELGVAWVGIAGDPQSVSTGFEEGLMAADFDVERFSGRDRFATAAQIGQLFDGASTVLVASGQGFADALPGAAAAGTNGAPMLLSRSSCMPPFTTTALEGWQPRDVWLLGGEPTLSPAVAAYTACR